MSLSVAVGACFPGNPKAQNYAKLTEGGLILGGVAMLYFTNTGADCDAMGLPGLPDSNCHSKASVLGDIGLGLILAGLVGFIATISTAEDAKPTTTTTSPAPPKPEPVKAPAPAEPTPAPAPMPTPAAAEPAPGL